jgi:hypothetical protein
MSIEKNIFKGGLPFKITVENRLGGAPFEVIDQNNVDFLEDLVLSKTYDRHLLPLQEANLDAHLSSDRQKQNGRSLR